MIDSSRLQVLFVDDEPRILDGLRRQLRPRRDQWEMRFAHSGAAALAMMAESAADVVVTDMRMPEMTGSALLREVYERYPQTVRIVLSGEVGEGSLSSALSVIHQVLRKPCDAETLTRTINRLYQLQGILRAPRLREIVVHVTTLPPQTAVYRELVRKLDEADADVSELAEIVSRDASLTAKTIQLVNSAFFGLPRSVNGVHEALVLLGIETLRSVVVCGRIFDGLASRRAGVDDLMTAVWQESAAIGIAAEAIASESGATEIVIQRARLAGMLSLVGRAILIVSQPEVCERLAKRARSESIPLGELEFDEFHAAQESIGAYALGIWGFDDEIVEAVHASAIGDDRDRSTTRTIVQAARCNLHPAARPDVLS